MSEPIRLIALTGRAGAGKDSVAATLVRHLNYKTIAFADALRAEVAEAWRIDARMLTDPATKEWAIPALAVGNCCDTGFVQRYAAEGLTEPRSPRWVMQRWGDYRRAADGDCYAKIVARWIRRNVGTGWTRLCVTDLRFVNELAWLQAEQPKRLRVVRVLRPGAAVPLSGHASEHQLASVQVDRELMNDGSLADLVQATLEMERGVHL